MRHATAFTLIELLVVITIIVILLALLVPALDKAIYEAELAICKTRLRGIHTGAVMYAVNAQRSYPDRPAVRNSQPVEVINLADPFSGQYMDARKLLRPYLSINGFMACPFAPEGVDFDGSRDETVVEANYNLFFGAQYAGERGMMRLGDRLHWEGRAYRVFAQDHDALERSLNATYTSHPDRLTGLMHPQVVQDDDLGVGAPFLARTFSRWALFRDPFERGPIDTQHVLDDGAVGIFRDVTGDETETDRTRITKVPHYTSGNNWSGGAGSWKHIPNE